MSWKTLLAVVLIAGLAAFTLAYAAPTLMRITGIDSGIFQYVGQGILSGGLPYRDLYDHKPPAIFYINALGLALGRGSRWGIWSLEWLSLTSAGILCGIYLRRYFGGLSAALATAAFVLNLTFFHQGGNLTEEYALPLVFGALLSVSQWEVGKRPRLSAFFIGTCAAGASTLKQPLGAIGVGIVAYMLIRSLGEGRSRRLLVALTCAAIGVAAVWASWFLYFSLQGILPQFWEAAFAYNFALSGISTWQRLAALRTAVLTYFEAAPFFKLALLSWLAAKPFLDFRDWHVRELITGRWLAGLFMLAGLLGLYNGLFRRDLVLYSLAELGSRQIAEIGIGIGLFVLAAAWLRSNLPTIIHKRLEGLQQGDQAWLRLPLLIAVIDLPLQLTMMSLSGNDFEHYYMSALPSLTVLCGFFFWYLRTHPQRTQATIWVLVLALPILAEGAAEGVRKARVSEDRYTRAIAGHVLSVTQPKDSIFYWGNLVPVYIESQRKSPSRFFFTDPLFLRGYTNRHHTSLLLRDLQAKPPALIVSGSTAQRPLLYTAEAAACGTLASAATSRSLASAQFDGQDVFVPEGMPEVYAWICANYTAEDVLLSAENNWVKTVYHYTPGR